MNWNKYKKNIKEALDNFKFDDDILKVLQETLDKDHKIFVAGNGGSAAIANHYVCDLSKGATQDWDKNFRRFRSVCLSSNIGYLTAISNDAHYEQVFEQQLINLADEGDIVILISSSGNSPNVVRAAEYSKKIGMKVIGITGFNGGKLKELADHSAHMEFNSYEVCEDIHQIFGHFLVSTLREGHD